MPLRLLADENVYEEIVLRLRKGGHDITTAAELGLSGKPDPEILRAARIEHRTLVTFDRDFGDLRYLPADGPGIVLLRFRNTSMEDVAERVTDALAGLTESDVSRSLAVITPTTLRRRPLGEPPHAE